MLRPFPGLTSTRLRPQSASSSGSPLDFRRSWRTAALQPDNGSLLDLDQGSMTVWKNDEKLGVIQVEGLSGEFCWAV